MQIHHFFKHTMLLLCASALPLQLSAPVTAAEIVPNPDNIVILSEIQPAHYIYTGKEIRPALKVLRADGTEITPEQYSYTVLSQNNGNESAGTEPGTVRYLISAASNSTIGFTPAEGQFRIVKQGDCNLDQKTDQQDAASLLAWLKNTETPESWRAADMNSDGILNAADLTLMKRKLLTSEIQTPMPSAIRWTARSKGTLSPEMEAKLMEAVLAVNPDFDFEAFKFDSAGIEMIPSEGNDMIHPSGTTFLFRLYYNGLLLDEKRYMLRANQYNTGEFALDAAFLEPEQLAKLNAIDKSKFISQEDAIKAAKADAASIEIAENPAYPGVSGMYQPSKNFGKHTETVVYSAKDGTAAYLITDTSFDYAGLHDVTDIGFSVRVEIYVDAVSGEILSHQYTVDTLIA